MADIEKDPVTGQYTTGHSWNGISELRTPVPQWWMIVWIATIVFSLVYVVLLPAIPFQDKATPGILGYTAREDLEGELAARKAAQAANLEKIAALPLTEIAADPALAGFAYNGGRSAFAVNCLPCHGAGGGGQMGEFPSLIDDDWIWGGKLEDILYTVTHGIRSGADGARQSAMPSFGGMLGDDQIGDIADYVLALNPAAPNHARRDQLPGAALFQSNCAACHGANGDGTRALGAPKLNDAVWLYGGGRENIVTQVTHPHHGVMPSFGARLDPATVKMLAIYVHALGGGEPDEAKAGSAAAAGEGVVE